MKFTSQNNSLVKSKNGFYYGIKDRLFKSLIFGSDDEFTKWFAGMILKDYLGDIEVSKLEHIEKERPISINSERKKELDSTVVVNDKYLVNIEVDNRYDDSAMEKNYAYISTLYSQYVYKNKKYPNRLELISVDIVSRESRTQGNRAKHNFYFQDDVEIRYVRNVVKIVYNIEKIKEYWYDKDVENIKKYAHIMMLKMDNDELTKLVSVLNGEIREKIDLYRRRLKSMNEDRLVVKLPYTVEEEIEYAEEEGMRRGIEQGIEKTQEDAIKNMTKKKLDISFISECLGIPVERVKQIMSSIVL